MTTTIARLIAENEARHEETTNKILGRVNELESQLVALKSEMEVNNAATTEEFGRMLSQKLQTAFSTTLEMMNADPDNIRRQRQKMESAVKSVSSIIESMADDVKKKVEDNLKDVIQTSKDTLVKVLEDKNNAFLETVSKGVKQVVNALTETATATLRRELKTAVKGQIVIDDGTLEIITTKVASIVDEVVKRASCESLSQEVLSVLKNNLNIDLASKVQADLKMSVRSIKEILMHDIRGALDGQVKLQIEQFTHTALSNAASEATKVTEKFFEEKVTAFVATIVSSVAAAFRSSPYEDTQQDGQGENPEFLLSGNQGTCHF